jgi:osmotically-inducible protein OsmY
MKFKSIAEALVVCALACGGTANVFAAPQDAPVAKGKPTADNAKNNTGDRDTMQKIRKAVIADKSLSMNAHNAKIIAQNGKVTLRGMVNSDAEKSTLEKLATDVAGDGNVTNRLTVKPAVKKGTN